MTFVRQYALALVILGATIATAMWGFAEVPDGTRLPTHWNYRGQVDGYGSKTFALLFPAVIAAVLTAFATVMPKVDPRGDNLRRSPRAMAATVAMVNVAMFVIELAIVLTGTGRSANVARMLAITVGATFVVIGNYMPKLRSNFFLGARTPWTLSSEAAWEQTQRLGGRLLVVLGVATIAATLIDTALGFIVLTVGAITDAVVTSAYSFLVWRRNREPVS